MISNVEGRNRKWELPGQIGFLNDMFEIPANRLLILGISKGSIRAKWVEIYVRMHILFMETDRGIDHTLMIALMTFPFRAAQN